MHQGNCGSRELAGSAYLVQARPTSPRMPVGVAPWPMQPHKTPPPAPSARGAQQLPQGIRQRDKFVPLPLDSSRGGSPDKYVVEEVPEPEASQEVVPALPAADNRVSLLKGGLAKGRCVPRCRPGLGGCAMWLDGSAVSPGAQGNVRRREGGCAFTASGFITTVCCCANRPRTRQAHAAAALSQRRSLCACALHARCDEPRQGGTSPRMWDCAPPARALTGPT